MIFSIYDIVTRVIPGAILYGVLNILWPELFIKELSSEVIVLTCIYLLGHFNDAISGWSEAYLFKSFGGNPAQLLLQGKKYLKVELYERDKIKNYLKTEDAGILNEQNKIVNYDSAFGIMFRKVSRNENKRISDLQNAYYLSRNILIALLSGIVLIAVASFERMEWNNPMYIVYIFLALALLWLNWRRTKERNWYFCKEVMNAYLSEIESSTTK